ncbi:DUF1150 family protein [Roseibium sp.]|uniref:DUF1150 family protein n=1 Tax=Roseibium sp. TaxID=1936156 RepID=UPI003D0E585D
MSVDGLSELGTGDIAYIKPIKARDLKEMLPDVPPLHHNMTLYALLSPALNTNAAR